MKVRQEVLEEVQEAVATYSRELEASYLKPSAKLAYRRHAENFVRWLADQFEPGTIARNKRAYRTNGRSSISN